MMKRRAKGSPAEGEFLFEIDSERLEECVTALGGVPLLVRAARSLDVPGNVERHVRIRPRERGFEEATYLESFLVANAVGGEEFCDGNVPAQQGLLPVAKRVFGALPSTVKERYFRGDSACDEAKLLSGLRDEKREGGAAGRSGFAVSARMNGALRAESVALPEGQGQPYQEDSAASKECAELDDVPEESAANSYREPLR